jgi:hypothetical protein
MGGMEEGRQAFKLNNEGERNSFRAQPKEEEGVFIPPPPPSKNLTIAVPRAEYLGQIGAEYLPLDFLGKNPPPLLGANHQNHQHENSDNFCIRTLFSMILGSLE